jgi:RimJ/RimL family protein N-acetyltransferase
VRLDTERDPHRTPGGFASPKPSDKTDRLALGRDPAIVRAFGGSTRDLAPLTDADVEAWYAAVAAEPHGWMIEHAGRCIGNARLHRFDTGTRSARYAVGILDPALLGQGIGREVTALVLEYAFLRLDLTRIDLRVLAANHRAIRSYEASGFHRVAIERNAIEVDGEWQDDVIMAIGREQWPGNTRTDRG